MEHEKHGESSLIQTGMDLLAKSVQLWSTVSGIVSFWYDEEVMAEGRAHFDRAGGRGTPASSEINAPRHPASWAESDIESRFWATSSPWRLRMERRRDAVAERYGTKGMSDLVILNSQARRCWLMRGTEVRMGILAPDRVIPPTTRGGARLAVYGESTVPIEAGTVFTSPGTTALDVLLRPASLVQAFTFLDATTGESHGRSVIRLSCVPAEWNTFIWESKGLVAVGPASYELAVDREFGLVLEVEVWIDGKPGRRHLLTELQVDDPIRDTLFLPPEP